MTILPLVRAKRILEEYSEHPPIGTRVGVQLANLEAYQALA